MILSKLLRAFGETKSFFKGKVIHGKMIVSGFLYDVYSNNHLISMYAKCECLEAARQAFDKMPERNMVSWTILISAYSKMGQAEEALECQKLMIDAGYEPNAFTYVSAISACTSKGSLRTGKEIHGRLYRVEQDLTSYVSNSLISLYAKCRMIRSALHVFNEIQDPGLVSWSSIIAGFCQCGEDEEALQSFVQSRKVGVEISEFISATVLGACTSLGDINSGMQLHSLLIKCGVASDPYVETGIINLYVKCGKLNSAEQIFSELQEPGLTSSAALIGGYAQGGYKRKAVKLFSELHLTGRVQHEHTFSSVLPACQIEEGKQIHCMIIKLGFRLEKFVGNALLDLYAKCRCLTDSMKIYSEMIQTDLVTWNVLIAGHVQWGHCREATELFRKMNFEGKSPNAYTYSSILNVCGDLPAIEWGKQTHCCTIKYGVASGVIVGTAIIDMYAKCGKLSDARKIFNVTPSKNLITWNSMIVGYAQHGFGKEALDIFNQMQVEGIKPNDITFIGVLSACGHAGLVEEGASYFDLMSREHGINPRIDHYSCMVDLYGRASQLSRAYDFIAKMPIEPDKVIWRSFLAACKNHKELELGKYAAQHILKIDPDDYSAYLMLGSLYSDAEMLEEMANMRKATKERGFKKEPGSSWIEVQSIVHIFKSGDVAHRNTDLINKIVAELTQQMIDEGYVSEALFAPT
ncbi:pentatricopeptide repeat-containing protein At3g53360, mitochondrial-like [Aristolochia californica]|uniref:pentatricopeptide repeat-containing protein At3g53360, mitochondrial-like n=1 Tax=Aristolochia californica TaxID=171875 RepID=UPI0035DCAC5B